MWYVDSEQKINMKDTSTIATILKKNQMTFLIVSFTEMKATLKKI